MSSQTVDNSTAMSSPETNDTATTTSQEVNSATTMSSQDPKHTTTIPVPGPKDTPVSAQEFDSKTTPNRYEASLWNDISDYVCSRSKHAKDPITDGAVPFAKCLICLEELNIKGLSPVGPAAQTRPGAPIPTNGIQEIRSLTAMDLVECYRYGQSKPYRKFDCPICKADLHHAGCCCEVRPVMIPTNNPGDHLSNILALPRTLVEALRDPNATPNGPDAPEHNHVNTNYHPDCPDDHQDIRDDDQGVLDDAELTPQDTDHARVPTQEEDDLVIAGYGRKFNTAHENRDFKRLPKSSRLKQVDSNGSTVVLPARPLVYDVQGMPQPGFYPLMRLGAQYPNLQEPNGWGCSVTGGRLDKVVDAVCGQCAHDLTRYRAFYTTKHLDGGNLNQFSGLSLKLAVTAVYLRADKNGWVTKPSWGRWPKELDFMLQARGWTQGINFVDWKKGCAEVEGDWVPKPAMAYHGLRSSSDLEGMGPYPDWDELLQQPYWQARGITKVPRNHWINNHTLGTWVEGFGTVIFMTAKFSYTARYTPNQARKKLADEQLSKGKEVEEIEG
ncbi:hypothetical protein B0T20DRAFT_477783 [Sordaria brevicollis]|uniref:Uncharacterized protein n=1 Tax=Sordaria brevicollis TaxID=83679 RepID=A0AAE0PHG8_SORBR|nr:hypothetical protein B0T20DRAFT_477783 [Sordaria brevicollis]